MAWALIIGLLGSLAASIGWVLVRHFISQGITDRGVARVQAKHAPLAEREARRAPGGSSATPATAARPSFWVIARRDPSFSEAELRRWLRALHQRLLAHPTDEHAELSEVALQALRSGPRPFVRAMKQGRLELVSAYADELWANLELRIDSVLLEEKSESWRRDTLKLRRKAEGPWQLLHLETLPSPTLPKPTELPFGEAGPRLFPLPGAQTNWAEEGVELPGLDRVEAALRGEGLRDGLAGQWALEERLLAHWSMGRSLETSELVAGPVLRCDRDAGGLHVEQRVDLRTRAWLHPPKRPGEGPELAAPRALGVCWRLTDGVWELVDLRWMNLLEE